MFSSPRYMTRGISDDVPVALQIILWALIDDLKSTGIKLDYLQVFNLRPSPATPGTQIVEHVQEQPPFLKLHQLPLEKPLSIKVFCIDDGDNSTMLLAEEY